MGEICRNSIKLRLAINLADADPATAKTVAEAAIAGGVMTADTDSYSFVFDGSILQILYLMI